MTQHLRYLRAGLAATALFLVPGCSPLSAINALVPDDDHQRTSDIAYGPEARHRLDVYKPQGANGSKPVVVFLYGGSWKNGRRGDYRFAGQAFATRGYVTVIPDYRTYPDVRFPAFVEDSAAAVAWVRKNIARFGGDPNRIVLAGHSAGAHIAALLAYDNRYFAAAGVPMASIAGLVGLAGPYYFDPQKYDSLRAIFETAKRPDEARPITFVMPGQPPSLLLHGTADSTVWPKNSRELTAKLKAARVPVQLIELEDVGHIGILLALAKPFQETDGVVDQIVGFLERLPMRDTAGLAG